MTYMGAICDVDVRVTADNQPRQRKDYGVKLAIVNPGFAFQFWCYRYALLMIPFENETVVQWYFGCRHCVANHFEIHIISTANNHGGIQSWILRVQILTPPVRFTLSYLHARVRPNLKIFILPGQYERKLKL